MNITKGQFLSCVDHTILNPHATTLDVQRVCDFARENNCAAVCINPVNIEAALDILRDSSTVLAVVVGFPLGANTSLIKAKEAEEVYGLGASEIDMVINIGALKAGRYNLVKQDIKGVVKASPALIKVIIETCFLTAEEKVIACKISEEAGAQYVKTSTGFGTAGATLEDVILMKESVSEGMKIKAAGGIRDLDFALRLIDAGCHRLGLSRTKELLEEF